MTAWPPVSRSDYHSVHLFDCTHDVSVVGSIPGLGSFTVTYLFAKKYILIFSMIKIIISDRHRQTVILLTEKKSHYRLICHRNKRDMYMYIQDC